jgi:hypothetical protein
MAAAHTLPEVEAPISGYSFSHAPNLWDNDVRGQLSASAIKGFLNITDRWRITEAQSRALLGGIASSTFHAWKTDPSAIKLSQDVLTRISLVLGIFKATHIYFGEEWADKWVVLGNRGRIFEGHPPLDFMIRHGLPGMIEVRRLLDGWRGGR